MPRRKTTRRRPARERGGGRLLISAIALIGLAGLGVGAGYLGVQVRRALHSGELFDVREIQVEGARLVSEAEVLSYAGISIGDGLYGFDAGRIERGLIEHPLVERARLVRRPPHTLRIFVSEARPVAYVALGVLYAVDHRGGIFARAESLGGMELPVITGVDTEAMHLDDGETPRQLREALRVLHDAERAGIGADALAEVHLDPALGVELVLTDDAAEVHVGHGPYVEKLARLTRLRAALRRRGERATHIYLTDGADPRRVVVRLARAATPAEGNSETAEENAAKGEGDPST